MCKKRLFPKNKCTHMCVVGLKLFIVLQILLNCFCTVIKFFQANISIQDFIYMYIELSMCIAWMNAWVLESRFSCILLFATLWTVAHQAAWSMGFSRQEYWSGLPCPPPGDRPYSVIKPASLMSPESAGSFFTANTTWEASVCVCEYTFYKWENWRYWLYLKILKLWCSLT